MAIDISGSMAKSLAELASSSPSTTATLAPDTRASADSSPSAFATKATALASDQWTFFRGQTYDAAGHAVHHGHTEADDGIYQRGGTYWLDGTGIHGLDGRNRGHPWSAAFISWIIREAGEGTRFRHSPQHSVYIAMGIRDFLSKRADAGYWTVRLNAQPPKVGDLVCWSREPGVDYDHQKGGDYKRRSELVVEVEADTIFIIRGNVGDPVTKRPLRLDQHGFLPATIKNGETLFALMQFRI